MYWRLEVDWELHVDVLKAGCGLGGQTSSFGLGGHQTSSGNFVQTIQCDVTLKVNETIKVILRKMHEDHWEVKLLYIETPFLMLQ